MTAATRKVLAVRALVNVIGNSPHKANEVGASGALAGYYGHLRLEKDRSC